MSELDPDHQGKEVENNKNYDNHLKIFGKYNKLRLLFRDGVLVDGYSVRRTDSDTSDDNYSINRMIFERTDGNLKPGTQYRLLGSMLCDQAQTTKINQILANLACFTPTGTPVDTLENPIGIKGLRKLNGDIVTEGKRLLIERKQPGSTFSTYNYYLTMPISGLNITP